MAILFSAKFILFIIEIFSILEIISTATGNGGYGGGNNIAGVSQAEIDALLLEKERILKEKMLAIRKEYERTRNPIPIIPMGSIRPDLKAKSQGSEQSYEKAEPTILYNQPYKPSSNPSSQNQLIGTPLSSLFNTPSYDPSSGKTNQPTKTSVENPIPIFNNPPNGSKKTENNEDETKYTVMMIDENGKNVEMTMTQKEIDEMTKNGVQNPDGTISTQVSVPRETPRDDGKEDPVNEADIRDYLKKEKDNEWKDCWKDQSVIDMALSEHNRLREIHSSPPMTIDYELSKTAQAYAVKLAYAIVAEGVDGFQHSTQRRYGENLYMAGNKNLTCYESVKYAINAWYNEIKAYDYDTCSAKNENEEFGHFTQMIWANSKKLGIGAARINGKDTVVTRNFPKGNILTFFSKNVQRPNTKGSKKNP